MVRRGGAAVAAVSVSLATAVAFAAPSVAAPPAGTGGVCNGVVNQLSHRGTVQANLLKAAARQNAERIAALQAERSTLSASADSLKAQLADVNAQIAALDAEGQRLDTELAAAEAELTRLTGQRDAANPAFIAVLSRSSVSSAPCSSSTSRPCCSTSTRSHSSTSSARRSRLSAQKRW